MSRARKANIAHKRLSSPFGTVHPRGWRRLDPADTTKDRPAPTWIPLTTGVGITRENHRSNPVALNMRTTTEVVKPADTVSSIVNFLEIATAATAWEISIGLQLELEWKYTFMGCTGSGIPKKTPVTMFHNPENTKVADKEMELLMAKAIIRGSSVPRSPNEPEISARGDLRRVATLFLCRVWIFGKTMILILQCGSSQGFPL